MEIDDAPDLAIYILGITYVNGQERR
jgi:hypothetical protein